MQICMYFLFVLKKKICASLHSSPLSNGDKKTQTKPKILLGPVLVLDG